MPLTNIGFEQARTYAAWLSERTGKRYRLPTAVEWRYAANAERGQSDSPTRRARRTVNCVRSAGTNGERGAQLADTRQGPRNEWGLVHHIDNAREWVIGDNDAALVAGGSYLDDAAACDVDAIEVHSGVADARTGFRVLLEIE